MMRKTLAEEPDTNELRSRIAALTGDEPARFGKMSVGEAVCHVREAYRLALSGRALTPGMTIPLPPAEVKRLSLYVDREWPIGAKTPLELEVGQPGTVPAEFAEDKAGLVAEMERFRNEIGEGAHPYFGEMTREDWLRWGYLHADHHLRQFGR
jgi:hypothetical protein